MGLQDLNSVRAVCVWFGLAYSIFLMGGAYMGYRKGSTVSLVMGGLSAAGAMVGFALCFFPSVQTLGFIVGASIAGLLFLVFALRYYYSDDGQGSRVFFPAGAITVLSLLVLVAELVGLVDNTKPTAA